MWAITLLPFFANFYFRRLLNPFEAIGAMLHVVFFIVSIITLVVLAPRSSPDYVFKTLTHDGSGWDQPVVAFGIGLLTVAYPLTGFGTYFFFIKHRSNLTYQQTASCTCPTK